MDCTVSLAPDCIESRHMFCYITLYHIASYRFALNRILQHHIMLCLTMHRITLHDSCVVAYHDTILHCIVSYRCALNASYCLLLHHITLYCVASRHLALYQIVLHRIVWNHLHHISCLIASYCIISFHITSRHCIYCMGRFVEKPSCKPSRRFTSKSGLINGG